MSIAIITGSRICRIEPDRFVTLRGDDWCEVRGTFYFIRHRHVRLIADGYIAWSCGIARLGELGNTSWPFFIGAWGRWLGDPGEAFSPEKL